MPGCSPACNEQSIDVTRLHGRLVCPLIVDPTESIYASNLKPAMSQPVVCIRNAMRRTTAIAAVTLACLGLAAPCAQGAKKWQPHIRAAAAYAAHRTGRIAFAVRTPGHVWGVRRTAGYPSASVLKAMLLVAYLRRPSVRNRPLRGSERALLSPMIRVSDNGAAGAVLGIVGTGGLARLASHAGMRRFRPVGQPWGLSRIDAGDQTRFFLEIQRLLPTRHRAYAMHLLATISGPQRWGIGRLRLRGWHLYFKSGWGTGTGWIDNQVALLTRGKMRVSIAILTQFDGSHAYGKETLRGIAARLLRGLPGT